ASELEKHSQYSRRLSGVDRSYLVACRHAEQAVTRRTRWVRASIYTLLVGIIIVLVGWINHAYLNEQWAWYTFVRPYKIANIEPYLLTSEAERGLKAGQTFRECAKDCPEMVVLPPGEFMMGSPGATERLQGGATMTTPDRPQHSVS